VGLVSTKELISIGSREYRDIVFYKEFSNRYNKRETPNNGIEQFVKEGVNFKSRKSTLIFVDTAQHWLYDSQKFRPHAQAFLVQAVYGKATLGALSLHTYSEVNNGYGFKEYRLNTKYPFPDLNQAIIMGHHLKFEELIEIKFPQDSIRIIHHY
jgi:hypothetical protein